MKQKNTVKSDLPVSTELDEAMNYAEPIAPQELTTPLGMRLVYDYESLSFLQVMMAEECAMLHSEQKDGARDFDDMRRKDYLNFTAKVAACLFTLDAKPFTRDMYEDTLQAIESLKVTDAAKVEGCIRNFFTRRGHRALASHLLSRSGVLERMLSKVLQAQTNAASSSSVAGSHPVSTTAAN